MRDLDAPSIDARLSQRFVALAHRSLIDPAAAQVWPVLFTRNGRWFRGRVGPWTSLERRRALPLLLAALLEKRLADPGAPLKIQELVAAGWPDEKILEEAAVARVYVALSSLRKMGLEGALESLPDGAYRLDPSVPIAIVDTVNKR